MKSRITRRILKAAALFSGTEALGMLCGMLRMKLIAILIGAAGVGLLGILTSVCDMASALVASGVRTGGVREIASSGSESRGRYIALVRKLALWIGLGSAAITAVLSPLFSRISFGDYSSWPFFVAVAFAVALNSFTGSESAIMQGTGKLRALARSAIKSAVLSLLVSAVAVYYLRNVWGIVAVVLIYSLVTGLTYMYNGRRESPSARISMSVVRSEGLSLLKISAALTVSGFLTVACGYAVISAINTMGGLEISGLYQAGFIVTVKYIGVIFTALAVEYFPRISSTGSRWRTSVMMRHQSLLFLPFATLGAVILAFAAEPVVYILYDRSFAAVVPMVLLALPSLPLRLMGWNMAFVVLAKGSPRLFLITEVVGGLLMTGCIIGGYCIGGLAGAGAGITVEYLLYAIMEAIVLKRSFGISAGNKIWAVAILSFIITTLVSVAALNFRPDY